MASLLRSWSIRLAILALLGGIAFAGYTALTWVGPDRVREAVLAHLESKFGDRVEVQLGSASMRLFGGITIGELRLTRKGEALPFLEVPSAVIHHDKEKLPRGELDVRKIECDDATIRIERAKDGTWSFDGLAESPGDAVALPTLILRNATLVLIDRTDEANPGVAVRKLELTVMNDPLPIVKFEASGTAMAAPALHDDGSVQADAISLSVSLSGRYHRTAKHLTLHVETGDLELGPDLGLALAKYHPQAAEYAGRVRGKVALKADLSTNPDDPTGLPKYDVKLELKQGRYEDDQLPWPLDRLAGTIRLHDGKLTIEKMTGKLGNANAELTLDSKPNLLCSKEANATIAVPGTPCHGPRCAPILLAHRFLVGSDAEPKCDGDPIKAVEDRLDRFELKVLSLSLDDELFGRLTPDAQKFRKMFDPKGLLDVAVRFRRPDRFGWRREVDVMPKGLSICYEHFKYPITQVYGSLKKVNASDGTDEFQADVHGLAAGKRITLAGRVASDTADPLIDLAIATKDVPIDANFFAALPADYTENMKDLDATARGDFTVAIKQDPGFNRFEYSFKIDFYGGKLRYAPFPYKLDRVRGLFLFKSASSDPKRPLREGSDEKPPADVMRIELRGVEAVHDGGRLWLSGESKEVPDGPDRKLTLQVQGENCPLDDELRQSFRTLKLDGLFRDLAPSGDLTFGTDIELMQRAKPVTEEAKPVEGVLNAIAEQPVEPPFDAAKDLKVAFNFRGPSIQPAFFPYELRNLAGLVRYQRGRVELVELAARHGTSVFKLGAGDVRFAADGGFWAHLGKISISPIVVDQQLLKACPKSFRTALEGMKLRGTADLAIKDVIVKVPAVKPEEEPSIVQAGFGERTLLARQSASESRTWGILPHRAARRGYVPGEIAIADVGLQPFAQPWNCCRLVEAIAEAGPKPLPLGPAVVYWNGTLKLNGASFEAGTTIDDAYGSISCEGRYEGTHLGSVVGTVWLDRLAIAKQPITAAKVSYRIRSQQPDTAKPGSYLPPLAEFRDLDAEIFGGTIGGEARVLLDDRPRYRAWITASGVQLEQLAKHNKLGSGELKGEAQGQLLLENPPDPKTGRTDLVGRGQVDVPQGRLYNLPVLLELVKVLKGQTPDGVAFEEAHVNFELKGDRVRVTQLDLLGSAVSLGGSGQLDLQGRDVHFEFYTIWSQTLRKWLTTPFGDVTGLLSGGLFKIELTRVDGELKPKAVMLPAVTDPMKAVAERWRNRFHREPPTVRAAPR